MSALHFSSKLLGYDISIPHLAPPVGDKYMEIFHVVVMTTLTCFRPYGVFSLKDSCDTTLAPIHP
jgi:hypothetical protein